MARKQTIRIKISHKGGISEVNHPDATDETISRARHAELFIAGALPWPSNWKRLDKEKK